MLNIVIPIAERFSKSRKNEYLRPKILADFLDKPMLFETLGKLNIPNSKFILLMSKDIFLNEQEILNWVSEYFNFETVIIDKTGKDIALSVIQLSRLINNDDTLLYTNNNIIIDFDVNFINDSNSRNLDSAVLCYEDNKAGLSYVKVNEDSLVTMVGTKERISKYALPGVYYFKNDCKFILKAIDLFVRNNGIGKEFPAADFYNSVIEEGGKIGAYLVDKNQMYKIETPTDAERYALNTQRFYVNKFFQRLGRK